MDTYVEALKVNPYLWEAFDGLIELGITRYYKEVNHPHRGVPSCGKLFQGKYYNEGSSRSYAHNQHRHTLGAS
jgi:hypothetical protein